MALYTFQHDAPTIAAAARTWVDRSLVHDKSVFSDETISTLENFNALDRYFVQRPDEGSGGFYDKLKSQLEPASPGARKLMAELIWALFLFPSNITEDTKRDGIVAVWSSSGDELSMDHPLLGDATLDGVGSAGMGVNSNRWRELNFMIAIGQSLKAKALPERRHVLADYDAYIAWIETVPQEGNRQFRHMFRYLLFPERVERMSSNGDRRKVLAAFGVAPEKKTTKWTDRQFDDAMLKLRSGQEVKLGTKEIDFYLEPLRSRWKSVNDPEDAVVEEASPEDSPSEKPKESAAIQPIRKVTNLILYGPPGTGKTYRLKTELFKNYTERAADLDRAAWLQQLVAPFGWRAVIAAALAGIGGKAKVDSVEAHELVAAKAIQRQRKKNVRATLWGFLQSHTSQDSQTVNYTNRRPPFVFSKDAGSYWSLLPEWRDADSEAADLHTLWSKGQAQKGEDVLRYRVVTFHPSYSYEDFVVGLRPVVDGDGAGAAVAFRMVDGVFKQICADARANPGKRYALFIDEINRAQIAKVFGELITLIEPDKRARYDEAGNLVAGMEVQLPGTSDEEGGAERFGVPENLDIIGTMNTADRSIALLDIALRRRFEFEEMAPNYDVIRRKLGSVDLAALLARINDRIEYLADRDRLIGHAYFTRVLTIEELRDVFRSQVIPLLQEYFVNDFSRVEQVLSAGNGRSPFLARQKLDPAALFAAKTEVNEGERVRYALTTITDWSEDAFRSLYETAPSGGA